MRPILFAALLGACAVDADLTDTSAELLPVDLAGVPTPPMTVTAIAPGQPFTMRLAGLPAGARVFFYVSPATGTGTGPCHPTGICGSLPSPFFSAGQITSAGGGTSLTLNAPGFLVEGNELSFQSIVTFNGIVATSTVVRRVVGDADLDGYAFNEDCDDTDPTVGPGPEIEVTFDPSTPTTAGSLTAVVDLLVGGTGVTFDYQWSVNGMMVAGITGDTLPATEFLRDNLVEVNVEATDGPCSSATSASVVIENSVPTLDDCVVSPTDPTVTDELMVTAVGSDDADGDPVSVDIQWQLRFGPLWVDLTGETSPVLASCLDRTVLGTPFNCFRGSDLRAVCTASDGTVSSGDYASNAVTIVNTPPELTACDIVPAPPTTFDALQGIALADDVDGDALIYTYEWFVDGVPVATAQSLSSALTTPGDVVSLICTAIDSVGAASIPLQATVVIGP